MNLIGNPLENKLPLRTILSLNEWRNGLNSENAHGEQHGMSLIQFYHDI